MNKKDLAKLALLGLASGAFIASQNDRLQAAESTKAVGDQYSQDNGNIGYKLLSEDELLLELNEQGEELYMNLNKEGKELARKVASQRCNGTNLCKGLNACQTETNACAGQGACKGQGKCGFSDKNLAVKVVANKMAQKRKDASRPQ
jgi:hypothetical protein